MEGAQLVRHRMADAEEGVRERDARHRGGVRHLFARDGVVCAVRIGAGQVFKDLFGGYERLTVGVRRSHDGGICLERMGERVDTGRGGQTLRHGHHEVCVDDRHLREQFVVGEGVLDARRFVGDDGERRDLGTGTGGGRDGDEVSLFAHLGEGVHPLADIHEAHRHVEEVHFGMFVEHPHDLAGIHRGAAAEGDDHVGLEVRHQLGAFLRAGEVGIGRDVVEAGVADAHFVELVGDGLDIVVLIQEFVGDDERPLLVHDVFEFVEGDGQAAPLVIDFFRQTQPQHILFPLR